MGDGALDMAELVEIVLAHRIESLEQPHLHLRRRLLLIGELGMADLLVGGERRIDAASSAIEWPVSRSPSFFCSPRGMPRRRRLYCRELGLDLAVMIEDLREPVARPGRSPAPWRAPRRAPRRSREE
jgi:hypothetical protein